MTDEQQAQRALTGKVEVFVGDAHHIVHNDKLVIARITKITSDHIFFDYSNKPNRWWGKHLLPFDHYTSHEEFISKLKRVERYKQRESVVLDLSEPQAQFKAAQQYQQGQIAQYQQQGLRPVP